MIFCRIPPQFEHLIPPKLSMVLGRARNTDEGSIKTHGLERSYTKQSRKERQVPMKKITTRWLQRETATRWQLIEEMFKEQRSFETLDHIDAIYSSKRLTMYECDGHLLVAVRGTRLYDPNQLFTKTHYYFLRSN